MASDPLPTLRFRAVVVSQKVASGAWSWLDVPERVTRALTPWQKAGHVRIDATLNDVSVQGSLTPRGGGRQMLVLNAAMRRDAGIKVGDAVRVTVTPRVGDAVRVPEQLAAGLDAAGARATFEARSSSHRWELVRYFTQANTDAARARAVAWVVDHVLGRAPADTGATRRRGPTGWYCPACGKRFTRPDTEHPCAPLALEVPFAHKPAVVRALFDDVRAMVMALGNVTVAVQKDSVGFIARRRFLSAVPRKGWLELRLLLTRRVEHPRVKAFTSGPGLHVHVVRVVSPGELDDDVKGLLREAFAYGLPAGAEPKPRDAEAGSGWERDADDSFFAGLDEV
jgi:hypothetical protein